MKPFEPGEVAVLLNNTGGRLFVVHRINDEGRVVERSSRKGQQPYAFDVHPRHLVKVPSIESADMLVATLGRIHADFEQRAWRLNAERSREMAAAIKPYVGDKKRSCSACFKIVSAETIDCPACGALFNSKNKPKGRPGGVIGKL